MKLRTILQLIREDSIEQAIAANDYATSMLKNAKQKKLDSINYWADKTKAAQDRIQVLQNKGEKIAFCLTKKKEGKKLIDLNTLTFVAIHELSHLMTKSIGHKLDFWQNFKFLLENAKEANIYLPEDYKKKPKQYCGMDITDNPYYDLK